MPHASSCVVIPARRASTRLPGKMLLRETGKPLIQHTFESARDAERPGLVVVATDDAEIAACVEGFGGRALMTSVDCQSGADRVAEAADALRGADILINVQGDEPEIEPAAIDAVAALLEENPAAEMATLAAPIRDPATLADPACVKVVTDAAGRALYFSRSPIPFVRDGAPRFDAAGPPFLMHVGLYAYRRDFLKRFAALPPSPLELAERLEQLRALEAGATILVGRLDAATPGIDTPADYRAFVERHARRHAAAA